MSHLFILTVGPVQSFIEASRKMKDMLAASRILSQTVYIAIDWLRDPQNSPGQKPATIIFPVVSDTPTQGLNIPNRLIAQFDDRSDEELIAVGQQLSMYIRSKFGELCKSILEKGSVNEVGIQLAETQLADFLEIYWLFEPYDANTSDGYITAYNKLYDDIQAVKNIRPFAQTAEPWSRKCTLFPEYNAIFVRQNDQGRYPHYVNERHMCPLTVSDAVLKPNEALSAIALVKRLYEANELQLHSLRLMMLKSRCQGKLPLDEVSDEIASVIYDCYNGNIPDPAVYSLQTIDQAAKPYRAIKEQHIALSSYYALIKFDGDNMGEVFRKQLTTPAKHRDLSQKLSEFAQQAPEILLAQQGLPVYAGGEDFFGFLPLDTLFTALQELNRCFHETTGLTFSAGIAIAHLMQPLKDVIAEADRQEKTAKALTDKHAFALGLLKRSGESVALPAYHLSAESPNLTHLQKLVTDLKDSAYSKSLLYNITQLLEKLRHGSTPPASDLVEVLLRDLISGSDIVSPAIAESLCQDLLLFYNTCTQRMKTDGLQAFLNTLNAAAFIAREVL